MKARRLIEGASYPPEALAVLSRVFDQAWLEIESDFVGDSARENARLKLAGIILMLAPEHVGNADELKRTALKLMARGR